MTNTEYRITNKNGVTIEVSEAELFKIAEHWVDDYNQIEYDYAESNGQKLAERLWIYPDIDQVHEILEEYMQCEVVQLDEDETVERDTHKLYCKLL